MSSQVVILHESDTQIYSPFETISGAIVVASENGSILKIDLSGQVETLFTIGGQASGVLIDKQTSKIG